MKKFLLISSWAPPMPGGSAVVLSQLLGGFPMDSYAVLTDRLSAFAGLPSDGWLPAAHYFYGSERRYSAVEAPRAAHDSLPDPIRGAARTLVRGAVRPLSHVIDVTTKLRELTRLAERAIEFENAAIVLVTSGDPVFTVAAAKAARATGRPLYVHLFDLLARNRYSPPKRLLAALSERDVLTGARRLFVPNPAMASHYRDRYPISPIVVPNGTLVHSRPPRHPVATPATILYTGAIYWAQRDAMRNLVNALPRLDGVNLRVRTNATSLQLRRVGLRREHADRAFSSHDDALHAQRNADLLFLPLAFRTSAPDVIRTALPGKTAEYLVSGTPILVHAPPDAYISRYARSAKWGYVVDTLNVNPLIAAVKTLLNDTHLRDSLTEAAFKEAINTHDLGKIVAEYATYFA